MWREGALSCVNPTGKDATGRLMTASCPVGWDLWAEEGHVIAGQQLKLPQPSSRNSSPSSSGIVGRSGKVPSAVAAEAIPEQVLQRLPLSTFASSAPSAGETLGEGHRLHVERRVGAEGTEEDVVVSGPLFVAIVSGASGCLSSLLLPSSTIPFSQCAGEGRPSSNSSFSEEEGDGSCAHRRRQREPSRSSRRRSSWREHLASPLRPCMWRALTDNDRGGSGGTSYGARWAAAGLDRMETSGESPRDHQGGIRDIDSLLDSCPVIHHV